MALTDKIVQTITLADGATVTIRKPGARIHSDASKAPEGDSWKIYLQECIKSWSYDDPVTEESIGNLELEDISQIMASILETEPPKNSTRRSTKP